MPKKPRLAGITAGVRRQRIFEGRARDDITTKTAAILATGRSSKFENEADCRHGLRQALVLAGHRWPIADLEAASIVGAALDRIGAVRPPWSVGQPEATIGRENCQNCRLPISDEDMAAGRRFCSDWCAASAKTHRQEWFALTEERARHAANFVAATAIAPLRQCTVCPKSFRSMNPEQTTCSKKCGAAWRIKAQLDRTCARASCGKAFHADHAYRRFCSPDCARLGLAEEQPMKICADPDCLKEFRPKHPKGTYCSKRCSSRSASRAKRERIRAAKRAAGRGDTTFL